MEAVATVAVRCALYCDLMALFGLAAFPLHAPPARGTDDRRPLAAAALLGLLLSLLALAALAAAMEGVPIGSAGADSFQIILAETDIGAAWLVRMVALLAALAAIPAIHDRPSIALPIVAAASAVAVGSLAWTGHGAMDDGGRGWVHLGADIVHLLAASLWLGALLGLLRLLLRPADRLGHAQLLAAHRALAGFSRLGTLLVAALVVTGVVNLWLLVGLDGLAGLPGHAYGQLLILKLLLFAAMLALASANRFRLVPRFEQALAAGDSRAALAALRRSLASETAGAIAILALVAWLGTLEPLP